MIRRDDPDRNDVLGANHDGFGSHRHHRIEIASGQRIAQITEIVGKKSLQQRKIRAQRGLDQIALPVCTSMRCLPSSTEVPTPVWVRIPPSP